MDLPEGNGHSRVAHYLAHGRNTTPLPKRMKPRTSPTRAPGFITINVLDSEDLTMLAKTAQSASTPNVGDPQLATAEQSAKGIRSRALVGANRPDIGVKSVITSISVRKPRKTDFTRVHGGKDMHGEDTFTTLYALELKGDNASDMYFIDSDEVMREMGDQLVAVHLCLAIDTQNEMFLWFAREPADEKNGKWFRSAMVMIHHAKEGWVQVRANMREGRYDMKAPIGNLPDPKWPDKIDFWKLVEMGVDEVLIKDMDHPVIKHIRGAI